MKTRWVASITSACSAAVAIVCPLCIPAVGAFMASLGLGFAVSVTFLKPFLIGLLLASIASLMWSVRLHKRWWVLPVALVGAGLIYVGRYLWFSQTLMGSGAALLIGISLVNVRLKASCRKCA